MTNLDAAQSEHDNIALLLPWYLNRTLSATESERVKQHIAQCQQCQKDSMLMHDVLEVASEGEVPMSSNNERLDRVFTRIDCHEQEQRQIRSTNDHKRLHLVQRVKQFFSVPQRTIGLAFSVFAAVVLLQVMTPTGIDDYEVRSSNLNEDAPLVLNVRLEKGLSNRATETLLSDSSIQYQWRLENEGTELMIELPSDLPASDVMRVMNTLNQLPEVVSVETQLPQ